MQSAVSYFSSGLYADARECTHAVRARSFTVMCVMERTYRWNHYKSNVIFYETTFEH